ncbi:MAG: ArsC/Spx/MgsR family protein [Pseudomonadota bacterium]
MKLYGIKTCDTCRKALKELAAAGHDVALVDVRAEAVGSEILAAWMETVGPDLVNRRSTTWKGLSDEDRAKADTTDGAVALLTANPTLMKRPVIETGTATHLGWTPKVRGALGL